jgi:DNA polymerase-3 subunit delta
MIIKSFEIKNKINKKTNFYLLYGPNTGQLENTIENFLKPIFSKNIFRYEESEIINNIDVFKSNIFNKSFFENEKLIIIDRSSDKIYNLIKEIIELNPDNIKIIIKSTNLEKKSKLRNFFEKNKEVVIIPHYEDNYQTLSLLTQNFLKEKKITLSKEVINIIIGKARGNREVLKNELEKIYFLSRTRSTISQEQIIKLTNLIENYDISELINECLIKNKNKTIKILNENNLTFEDNIIIMKSFLNKLKRLQKLKEEILSNKNVDNAISSFKPSIFWKEKEIVKKQLNVLSIKKIRDLIKEINYLELLLKKNSQISNQILSNFIFQNIE